MHIIRPHFFGLSIWHRVATVMVVKAALAKVAVATDRHEVRQGTWRQSRCLYQEPSKGSVHTGVEIPFLGVFGKKITYRHIYLSICCCLVFQSCPVLCHPMDCSLPGSSIHGISQARTLEWVAISFSRGSSWPRDRTCVSCTGRQILLPLSHWGSSPAKMLGDAKKAQDTRENYLNAIFIKIKMNAKKSVMKKFQNFK